VDPVERHTPQRQAEQGRRRGVADHRIRHERRPGGAHRECVADLRWLRHGRRIDVHAPAQGDERAGAHIAPQLGGAVPVGEQTPAPQDVHTEG